MQFAMDFQTCWRCFLRSPLRPLSSQFLLPQSQFVAAFQTSAFLSDDPRRPRELKRGEKTAYSQKKKKKSKRTRPKRTHVEEKMFVRKRIVLSNNNAVEVQGIQNMTSESIADKESHGQIFSLLGNIVDRLRAVEAFKSSQNWHLYRKPCTLIRRETLEYGGFIQEIGMGNAIRKTIRRVLVGERGDGKSIILLQVMAMAFLKNWIVINLPDAHELTAGYTEYNPIRGTSPMVFNQKVYTASLLSAIAKANPILSSLRLSIPPPKLETPIPPSTSLSHLCAIGASLPDSALPIFQTLIQDLLLPSRPPILLCLDRLGYAMKESAYRDANFKPIHAHDLYLLKWFLGFLSGASPLPNGGIVLAATSGSDTPLVPALEIAIQETEKSPQDPGPPPYPKSYKPIRHALAKYDSRVLDVFAKEGLEIQRLERLSKDEARALMLYWAQNGMLGRRIDEDFVAEKWAISGGGVVGELERATVQLGI